MPNGKAISMSAWLELLFTASRPQACLVDMLKILPLPSCLVLLQHLRLISPVSATTVVNCLSCSRVLAMITIVPNMEYSVLNHTQSKPFAAINSIWKKNLQESWREEQQWFFIAREAETVQVHTTLEAERCKRLGLRKLNGSGGCDR